MHSNYRVNTHEAERQVIKRIAEIFNAPKDNYWGYVTNGGTEGNLYGLYLARELYPEGLVYYSDQAHYSIAKNLKILRMPAIKIPSQPNGEIDYIALRKEMAHHKKTPIIVANIGSTMKGAIDNIVLIKEILSDLKMKEHYLHCDAAFFGLLLPFVPEPDSNHLDFSIGIDSIAVSGHKMIGTPVPCGVVLTRKSHLDQIGSDIEYTGSKDSTITGSRNGITPLFLWHELVLADIGKFEKRIKCSLDNAAYAVAKFHEYGVDAWRNRNSPIVVFPKPHEDTIKKWQLASEGDISHMITLPHLSHKLMDRIIKQIARDLKKRPKRN